MTEQDPNGTDYQPGGYKQPNCAVCGRFAAKDKYGSWYFPCVDGSPYIGWEHK